MGITYAFGSPMRDQRWFGKLALAALFACIPIVNFAVGGWGMAYIKNVADGRENELPEWGDFGQYWLWGLGFGFASALYYLPAVLLLILVVVPAVFASAVSAFSLLGNSSYPLGSAGLGGGALLGAIVALVYSVAISYLVGAVRTHYALSGRFGSAFEFGSVIAAVKSNASGYFVAWIMQIVVAIGSSAIGFLIGASLGWIPFAWIVTLPLSLGVGLWFGMGINGLLGQYAKGAYRPGHPFPSAPYPDTHLPSQGYIGPAAQPYTQHPYAHPAGQAVVAAAVAGVRAESFSAPSHMASIQGATAELSPVPVGDSLDSSSNVRREPLMETQKFSAVEDEPISIPAEAERLGQTESFAPVEVVQPEQLPREPVAEPIVIAPPIELEPVTVQSVEISVPARVEEQAEIAGAAFPITQPEVMELPVVSAAAPEVSAPAVVDTTEIELVGPASISAVEKTTYEPAVVEVAEEDTPSPAAVHLVAELPTAPTSIGENSAPVPIASRLVLEATIRGKQEAWTLPSSSIRIGRDENCFICLVHDGKVSRRHARITWDDGCARIEDLESSNGTYVNGSRIGAQARGIQAGDTIGIGDVLIQVRNAG